MHGTRWKMPSSTSSKPATRAATIGSPIRVSMPALSSTCACCCGAKNPGTGTHTAVGRINTIKDGSSNTVLFAEKMAACQRVQYTGTPAIAPANVGNLWWYPSSVDWYPTFAWNHPSYQTTQTSNPPYFMSWALPPMIQPSVARTGTAQDCQAGRPSTANGISQANVGASTRKALPIQ